MNSTDDFLKSFTRCGSLPKPIEELEGKKVTVRGETAGAMPHTFTDTGIFSYDAQTHTVYLNKDTDDEMTYQGPMGIHRVEIA